MTPRFEDAQDLLEKLAQGDPRALRYVSYEISKRLSSRANPEELKDITQEVLRKLLSSWGSGLFRSGAIGNLSAYLQGVAHHTFCDYLKQKERRVPLTEAIEIEAVPGNERVGPSHTVESAQLLERALGALDEKRRSVLLLKDQRGYTFVEISELLHEPAETIKTRYYAAKRQFLAAIEKD